MTLISRESGRNRAGGEKFDTNSQKNTGKNLGKVRKVKASEKVKEMSVKAGSENEDNRNGEESCQGVYNDRYKNLFEGHVRSVLALDYIDEKSINKSNSRLSGSKVTINASYYLPRNTDTYDEVDVAEVEASEVAYKTGSNSPSKTNTKKTKKNANRQETETFGKTLEKVLVKELDTSFENLPGTFWTSEEKETFFSCLARFSIHRIDEFLPYIPSKTRLEIETYYHLLKRELRQLTKVQSFRLSIPEVGDGQKYDTTYTMRVFDKGVCYWKIPSAYEVDEEWLDYEEEQSHLLSRKSTIEQSGESDEAEILSQYISHSGTTAEHLVDPKVANKISHLYLGNQITPIVRGQEETKLSFGSLVFLDELVKLRLRDLIAALVIRMGINDVKVYGPDEKYDPLKSLPKNIGAKSDCVVNAQDVWRATEDIRLMETKTAGVSSRYRDGKTPVMYSYWENLATSLKLDMTVRPSKKSLMGRFFETWCKPPQDTDMFFRQIDTTKEELVTSQDLVESSARGAFAKHSKTSSEASEDIDWGTRPPWLSANSDSDSAVESAVQKREASARESDSSGNESSDSSVSSNSSTPPKATQVSKFCESTTYDFMPIVPQEPAQEPAENLSKSHTRHSHELLEVPSSDNEITHCIDSDMYFSDIPKRVYDLDTLDTSTSYSKRRRIDDLAAEDMLEDRTIAYTEHVDKLQANSRSNNDRVVVGLPQKTMRTSR